jgi:predicted exporter
MSTTQPDLSLDSGANHLKPALIAIAIAAVMTVVTLALTGLPY